MRSKVLSVSHNVASTSNATIKDPGAKNEDSIFNEYSYRMQKHHP